MMNAGSADLAVRCACGTLRGLVRELSPRKATRAICHCDDCQKYAHFLQRADEILDVHGGTEVLQTSQGRLRITAGEARLACVRLTPKGILRWYADCCRTPIGNTPAARTLPYLGLVHACIDTTSSNPALEVLAGPVRWRVFGRHARGDRSTLDAHDGVPLSAMIAVIGRMVAWRLRGEHRRSILFDAGTNRPRVTPHVLTEDELRQAESAHKEWTSPESRQQ